MARNLTEKDSQHNHSSMEKLEKFWFKNQKTVTTVLAVIIIAIGGYYGYKQWVVKPNEEKAANYIFKAEEYFRIDSLDKALNGDGISRGFLYVIKNYGGTQSGNLAKYYAGVCYLKLSQFDNAIKYLKDFSTDAKQIQMMAYGCLGDAYGEKDKKAEAIAEYKKAASTYEDDAVNSSEYLFKAALLSEVMGKNKEAIEMYKQIKDKFPDTDKGRIADKYIYRLSIEKNEFSVK